MSISLILFTKYGERPTTARIFIPADTATVFKFPPEVDILSGSGPALFKTLDFLDHDTIKQLVSASVFVLVKEFVGEDVTEKLAHDRYPLCEQVVASVTIISLVAVAVCLPRCVTLTVTIGQHLAKDFIAINQVAAAHVDTSALAQTLPALTMGGDALAGLLKLGDNLIVRHGASPLLMHSFYHFL
jgi:hypothetical protein